MKMRPTETSGWLEATAGRGLLALLAFGALGACSSSSNGPPDSGSNPTTPVMVSVVPSTQSQNIPLPPNSGPVTGNITLPQITTVPAGQTGDMTLSVLSGTSVAFEQGLLPRARQASLHQRSSDISVLPGGPYIFGFTLSAPYAFTLPSVPGFTLNLNSLGTAAPNGNYVFVVEASGSDYYYPLTAANGVLTFAGATQLLSIAAGSRLAGGIALASNVCIPGGVISISATAPATITSCGQTFMTNVQMTNGSCNTVTVTTVALASPPTGACNLNGSYTLIPNVNVAPGATTSVLDLTNGNICCGTAPCDISCTDAPTWTVTTTDAGTYTTTSNSFSLEITGCQTTCG
jgi:hypothetical protein